MSTEGDEDLKEDGFKSEQRAAMILTLALGPSPKACTGVQLRLQLQAHLFLPTLTDGEPIQVYSKAFEWQQPIMLGLHSRTTRIKNPPRNVCTTGHIRHINIHVLYCTCSVLFIVYHCYALG